MEIWVFGFADTSHQPALGFIQIVPDRTAATLLPIIQAHIALGTIVHSDEWSSYHPVGGLPNVSSHTQNMESYWNRVKTKLKWMKRCHAHQLPSYLDEFLWRERFGTTKSQAYSNIMNDISTQYPVP